MDAVPSYPTRVPFRSSRTANKATPVGPREPRQPRRWRTEGHPRVPRRVGVRCPRSGRGPIWLRPLFHHPVSRSLVAIVPSHPLPVALRNAGAREDERGRSGGLDDDGDEEVLSRGGCDRVATLGGGGRAPLSDDGNRHTRGNARLCRRRVVTK